MPGNIADESALPTRPFTPAWGTGTQRSEQSGDTHKRSSTGSQHMETTREARERGYRNPRLMHACIHASRGSSSPRCCARVARGACSCCCCYCCIPCVLIAGVSRKHACLRACCVLLVCAVYLVGEFVVDGGEGLQLVVNLLHILGIKLAQAHHNTNTHPVSEQHETRAAAAEHEAPSERADDSGTHASRHAAFEPLLAASARRAPCLLACMRCR